MKNIFALIAMFLGFSLSSQTIEKENGSTLLEVTPEESVFVHFSTSLLFPGEYLYYRIYNRETATGNLSDISKVAYIELVGENRNRVFQHQVQLENGAGSGDFFIPTSLPSGNYKLLSYTNWMRNESKYFEADIIIINPYQGDQTAVTPPAEDSLKTSFRAPEAIARASEKTADNSLEISVNKKLFKQREKVNLYVKKTDADVEGSLSISVRKIDSIGIPEKSDAQNFSNSQLSTTDGNSIYLPEFRGDLISGKIKPKNSTAPRSLANIKVAFSIPGEQVLFKVGTTNSKGVFYVNFDEPRNNPEVLVQIVGEPRRHFDIQLDPSPSIDYSALDFPDFYITRAMQEWIVKRSVQNQIENAYYSQKPDTIITAAVQEPFFVRQPVVYDLDAYNRFPTIKETFVEIIQFAWLGTNSDGEENIVVREPAGASNYGLPALLLVDGVMLQDHSRFISYPAKNVQSIGILRENFFVGSHIFEGIVDVKTIDRNFWEANDPEYLLKTEMKVPEAEKSYFKQTYSDSTGQQTHRIPDFRTQLLWEPEWDLEKREGTVEFFTSDVPGIYEVELQGFTALGNPVSLRTYFRVEE